jgi:hypothetical protein
VLDRTGRFLRHWVIDDTENVHCMTLANDGMVYVCNRMGSEVRIYDKMGKLQRSIPVPWTPVTPAKDGAVKQSGGSAVAVDFSPDPAQRLMFVIKPEQLANRDHRARDGQEPRQLRPSGQLPRSVQPGPRHRGGLEGQHLPRREPRPARPQVQAGRQ